MQVLSPSRLLSIVGLTLASTSLPARSLSAQATTRNACADLAAIPSSLVNAPEGLALLRLKRELESAAFTLERQQQLQGAEVQRITQVQRGVDSLMRVIVRYRGNDGADGPMLTINRGDSVRMVIDGRGIEQRRFSVLIDSTMRTIAPHVEGTMRTMAPQVEATIRSLQPQITAFIAAAEAQSGRDGSGVGYMGVGLLGAQVRLVTPEGVLVSHCDYPIVETVDLGSPAARAGVASGDTVLAYNGRDLKQQAVNYQRMLVPGETVRMRVKRGSRAREIPVTVSERQTSPVAERQLVFRRVPEAPAGSGGVTVLFGAQLSTVDEDFAESLGMEPGVLLLRVVAGTPFAEAGLRAGEIIRTVNGAAVRDVQSLRRLIGGAGREARVAVISRSNGQRTVTVRW